MKVAVCDYGAGNVRSVIVALERLEAEPEVTADPGNVLSADLVVLPGVGAAASAMDGLRTSGLDIALRDRLDADRPILGICLGLHLALEESAEDGGVAGLGLLPGHARRLTEGRVPRIGWAPVEPIGEAFYFAHSFVAETPTASALSEGLVAEVRSGSFVGVQFHPEKSGPAGARYLSRLLQAAGLSVRAN